MKNELHKRRSGVVELVDLPQYSYEEIFSMYKDDDHFAYNILRTIKIPENLDEDTFLYTRISGKMSWTQISFEHYGTINLWWLICLANGIINPVELPAPGLVIKIIHRQHVKDIMNLIRSQL